MSITTVLRLSDEIEARTHAADQRLRSVPYYARLLSGRVTVDEYAGWLVQLHHYVRHTYRCEVGLIRATSEGAKSDPVTASLHEYAVREAKEEASHEDLLVRDLARLWGVSHDAARGRLEREPQAPAVVAWGSLADVMIARHPQGLLGVAMTLEGLAVRHSDTKRKNLIANSGIEGIAKAVSFLKAHSAAVEERHALAGREQVDALEDVGGRNATFFYANAALSLFEGLVHFLNERFTPVAAIDDSISSRN